MPDHRAPALPRIVEQARGLDADGTLQRCLKAEVEPIQITFSHRQDTVTLPASLIRFITLSVLFGLDQPRKWHTAWARNWLPSELWTWLGFHHLPQLAADTRLPWTPAHEFLQVLCERVGLLLIEIRQPRDAAWIRSTIRRLLFHKQGLQGQGLVMNRRYWKRFLRASSRPLAQGAGEEVHQRIQWALGRLELAELAPRHWRPIPELSPEDRERLEGAMVSPPPDRLEALQEASDAGLFDFLEDVLATTYSAYGRRAYHPVFMWKVVTAMVARQERDPATFLKNLDDSNHVRRFLGVMSQAELPSPRRIKGFLSERLAPAIEHVVLWFNVGLVAKGGLTMGEEFGTDGMEMAGQARTKSDAVGQSLKPVLEWLLAEVRGWLVTAGQEDLSAEEREELMAAVRALDWPRLGSAERSKSAICGIIERALKGELVTPCRGHARAGPGPPGSATPEPAAPGGSVSCGFKAFAQVLAWAMGERIRDYGPRFNWDTCYDPEGRARSKYNKTVHGFGLQFVIDLAYGLVWAFAVFPAGESFQPRITEFMLEFQKLHEKGELRLTSDREFTIAAAIHRWETEPPHPILHYGPRSASPGEKRGLFTQRDFEIHHEYAVCPNGKRMKRKPKMYVRKSNREWRYQARKTDCEGCPLRAQCTTGKGQRILAVNVYRKDVERHAARMAADPEGTRDLMARHRSLAESTVNNLKHHLGAKHAWWKGLAMVRVQFGLAIVMLNLLKWHKIRHGQLENLKDKRARQADAA